MIIAYHLHLQFRTFRRCFFPNAVTYAKVSSSILNHSTNLADTSLLKVYVAQSFDISRR